MVAWNEAGMCVRPLRSVREAISLTGPPLRRSPP